MALTKLNYTGQGTIPSAQMPTGSVLQVVSSIFTSTFQTNSTSYVDIGNSVNITPKSSSSVLYIEWVGNLNMSGINGMGVAFREGSTVIGGGSASDTGTFWYNSDNTANKHMNQNMMTTTASTGVSQRTFKISIKVTHGSATNGAKVEAPWGPSIIKVTEIAQ